MGGYEACEDEECDGLRWKGKEWGMGWDRLGNIGTRGWLVDIELTKKREL